MKKRALCLLLLLALLPLGAHADEMPLSYCFEEEIPPELTLTQVAERVYQVDGMNRLVSNCADYPVEEMAAKVANFNEVLDGMKTHLPTYLYFVENSRSHPVAPVFAEDSAAYTYLKEHLHVDVYDHLKYTTFAEYCRYYYTTDHHWNYRGSYQGYTDIIHMIKGADAPVLTPKSIIVTEALYNGSYCRDSGLTLSQEPFAFYRFMPFPQFTAYVEGKKHGYGRVWDYMSGKVNTKPLVNHYGTFYGGDFGLIVLEGAKKNKGNLLLISDSVGNAIKPLLSQHFNRIVSVDLRHYEEATKKPFSMREIVNKYRITDILFLGNVSLFTKGGDMLP